jgi:hypothetical protein
MNESENEGKGFKVTPEGDLREEAEDSPERSPQRAPSQRAADTMGRTPSPGVPHDATEAASGATFLDLVGMLATNAMLQLGDMPNPASGERLENLQAVQDMIAFLEILQQKTKGNLSEQEGEVLEQVLYDLRMRYMAKAKILNL